LKIINGLKNLYVDTAVVFFCIFRRNVNVVTRFILTDSSWPPISPFIYYKKGHILLYVTIQFHLSHLSANLSWRQFWKYPHIKSSFTSFNIPLSKFQTMKLLNIFIISVSCYSSGQQAFFDRYISTEKSVFANRDRLQVCKTAWLLFKNRDNLFYIFYHRL